MASQAISESVSVTLRPHSAQEDSHQNLPLLVRRIATERDGLKYVTEKSLEQEIAKGEFEEKDKEPTKIFEEEKSNDYLNQQKKLLASRGEMMQCIDQARNQAAMCLDLLSFQLKDHASQTALQTLSPYIKQTFPRGGLGLDKFQPPGKDPKDTASDSLTSTGWTLKTLNKGADLLLNSARKLNEEVEKETRYWRELSEVKKRGWSVCRVPRQKNLVGVRFGFSEASSLFQTHNLAALRADDDGNIILDEGLQCQYKRVVVRITENGQTIGESQVTSQLDDRTDVESRIQQASDSLFEEELFHEMICEARDLLAYNVKIMDETIHVPFPKRNQALQRNLIFSLKTLPQTAQDTTSTTFVSLNDEASAIILTARLLLSHTFRERFKRRCRVPSPLTREKKREVGSHILQPLMNYLLHRSAVETLNSFSMALELMFKAANISFSQNYSQPTAIKAPSHAPMEHLVSSLLVPYESTHRFILEFDSSTSGKLKLAVHTTTSLAMPSFGTAFQVTVESNTISSPEQLKSTVLTEKELLISHVSRQLCLALAKRATLFRPDWKQPDLLSPELQRVKAAADENGRKQHQHLIIDMREDHLILASGTSGARLDVQAVWPSKTSHRSFDEVLTFI